MTDRSLTIKNWKAWNKDRALMVTMSREDWLEAGWVVKPGEKSYCTRVFGPKAGPEFSNLQVEPIKNK